MTIQKLEDGSFIHNEKKYQYSTWSELIEQEVGIPIPTPCGPYVTLKIFDQYEKNTGKTAGGVILPSTFQQGEKFKNQCGLILAMGDGCDRQYPWKIGSWVFFRRYEIILFETNGVDLGNIFDDKIIAVFDDPDTQYSTSVYKTRN